MITFKKFQLDQYADCTIVTDSNLQRLYSIKGDNVLLLPEGEQAKTFFHAEQLSRQFLKRGLNKNDTIVAVGGGSIGDTVGFVASIFKRGVRLLQVPTTVLAMIDSSIGGKTALNLDGVKNAIGTFYPSDTLIDLDFLNTLDSSHFDDAKGEMEKYRLLSEEIDKIDSNHIAQLIEKCAKFKQEVVMSDPLDKKQRRQLNMGHTVGHALELSYNLSHGQAVLLGLFYEMKLAEKLGLLDESFVKDWAKRTKTETDNFVLTKEIVCKMLNDKKNSDNKICFVVPTANYQYSEVLLTSNEVFKIFQLK